MNLRISASLALTLTALHINAVDDHIRQQVTRMSSADLAGQCMMISLQGSTADELSPILREVKPGTCMLFPSCNDLSTVNSVRSITSTITTVVQDAGAPMPWAAIDGDGYPVKRLISSDFIQPPSQKDIADKKNPHYTSFVSYMAAEQLASLGITMSCAPVADVRTEQKDTVIGNRAYSNDQRVVTEHVAAALKGYEAAQGVVIPVLKHFPGHGGVDKDSHEALPTLHATQQQIEECHLLPFAANLDKAPAVMTAHIIVPAYDPHAPATMSHKIITGLLREKLGYRGIIITDSLVMKGALETTGSLFEAGLRALEAGCDILCIVHPKLSHETIIDFHKQLVAAIERDEKLRKRVEDAVTRILVAKEQLKQSLERHTGLNFERIHGWWKMAHAMLTHAEQQSASAASAAPVEQQSASIDPTVPMEDQGKSGDHAVVTAG